MRSTKPRLTRPQPDDNKLRELILYIAERSADDAAFGALKLNTLLFFSDFGAYRKWGRSITGQEYRALEQGPGPRRLLPVRRQMIKDRELAIQRREFYGKPQQRPVHLRTASLAAFSGDEIDLVDRLIQRWWGKTATEMSAGSHEFPDWSLAKTGETIPYSVALISSRELSRKEIEAGLALAAQAQRCVARHG
ncbi:MAG TPA: Panacea domain-containing protein [Planctomycetota bacterium]